MERIPEKIEGKSNKLPYSALPAERLQKLNLSSAYFNVVAVLWIRSNLRDYWLAETGNEG